MDKIIRAVSYTRYSSAIIKGRNLLPLVAYCKRKGYVLVKMYADEAKTATTDRRPKFQQIISDSALNIFDVVVIHKTNRFARNQYDSAFYKRKLRLNGLSVESVVENIDDLLESVILESVLEGMAEYFSLDLAREVMKGIHENAEQGIHIGGRAPYGLKVNPDTRQYEIDKKGYKAVQIYFEGMDNLSLTKIAEKLNSLGYRTQEGGKFIKNSFFGWAKNRKYIGDYVWNVASSKNVDGRVIVDNTNHLGSRQIIKEGIIPRLIDPQLFF